ncbi:hypothetical protein V8C86DRAFT_2753894, partial [Haematococcus lacustris]
YIWPVTPGSSHCRFTLILNSLCTMVVSWGAVLCPKGRGHLLIVPSIDSGTVLGIRRCRLLLCTQRRCQSCCCCLPLSWCACQDIDLA